MSSALVGVIGRESVRGPILRRVADLNMKDFPDDYRAGIIPYYYDPKIKDIIFCMGEDRLSTELTDFGGKQNNRDRSIIRTAIREFIEETQDILHLKVSHIKQDICLYNVESMIVFHPVNLEFYKNSIGLFDSIEEINKEISSIIWINSTEMEKLLDTELVYSKTKDIFKPRYKLLLSTILSKSRARSVSI